MPRYIDVENYCEHVCRCDAPHCDKSKCPIFNAPPAAVAPVVHGKWLDFCGDFSTAECSNCENIFEVAPDEISCEEFLSAFKQFYNYCPCCGAKMDLEDEG